MKYTLDDLDFCSIRELADYVEMNEKTITARLRRGMSVKEACEKKDLRYK